MSFRAVLAAIDIQDDRLETGEKFLLVVLGSYAGPDKSLFPSQSTLARDLSCSDRSVRAYLAKLEQLGYIKREKRRVGNRQTSDRITLVFEAETVSARWGKKASEAETNDASGGNQRPSEAETISYEPVIEPRIEPKTRERESQPTLVLVDSQAPSGSQHEDPSRAEAARAMKALAAEIGKARRIR